MTEKCLAKITEALRTEHQERPFGDTHSRLLWILDQTLQKTEKDKLAGVIGGWLQNGLSELLEVLIRKQRRSGWFLLKKIAIKLKYKHQGSSHAQQQFERLIQNIVRQNILSELIPYVERLKQLLQIVRLAAVSTELLISLLQEGLSDRLLKVLTLTSLDSYDEVVASILHYIGLRLEKEDPSACERYKSMLLSRGVDVEMVTYIGQIEGKGSEAGTRLREFTAWLAVLSQKVVQQ